MSIGDRRRSYRRRRPAGFSLIEVSIVVLCVAIITFVMERTASGVIDTERTMRAIRNSMERGQQATDRIRDLAGTSHKIYQNDAIGNGYLAKLTRTRFPPLTAARLPLADEVNPMGPDVAGSPKTGNCLLFVREGDPIRTVADKPTKKVRTIHAYRLVCFYLSQSTKTVVAGGPAAIDLVEWRSEAYPSYAEVSAITPATEKTQVVKDLYTRYGVDYLWEPSASATASFYGIDGTGNIAAGPSAVTSIPEDLNVSPGGRLVAGNLAVARTDTTSKPRTPLFTVDPIATWVPNGFEVKVSGPSGARQIWIHLTVEQQAAKGRVPAQSITAVANTRDL